VGILINLLDDRDGYLQATFSDRLAKRKRTRGQSGRILDVVVIANRVVEQSVALQS
jgi:hypothetical protein